ncbi:hypothetical protein L210DRAFT_3312358, partial [Boletus edulis BED1]
VLFDAVYDARDAFANKKDAGCYPVAELKKSDLVLMESKITKYRTKDADSKWALQRVQTELRAVSLLH